LLYLAWNLSDLAINCGVFFLLLAHFKHESPFDSSKPKIL
jgi:lipoprotein signal peptidase